MLPHLPRAGFPREARSRRTPVPWRSVRCQPIPLPPWVDGVCRRCLCSTGPELPTPNHNPLQPAPALPFRRPPMGNGRGGRRQRRGRTCPALPQAPEDSGLPDAWAAGMGATGEAMLMAALSHKNRQAGVILTSLVLILEVETKRAGLVFREYGLGFIPCPLRQGLCFP